jgi:hypothetical protein
MQRSVSRLAQERSDGLVADAKVGGKGAETLGASQGAKSRDLLWEKLALPRHLCGRAL